MTEFSPFITKLIEILVILFAIASIIVLTCLIIWIIYMATMAASNFITQKIYTRRLRNANRNRYN